MHVDVLSFIVSYAVGSVYNAVLSPLDSCSLFVL